MCHATAVLKRKIANYLILSAMAIVVGSGISCTRHTISTKQLDDSSKDRLQKSVPKQSDAAPVPSPCLDKNSRTSVQKKIDSQLLCTIYPPKSSEFIKPQLRTDGKGRVLVDIRSQVTDNLISLIGKLGGAVEHTSSSSRTILSYFPLDQLEKLAEEQEVTFIMPAAEAFTNR